MKLGIPRRKHASEHDKLLPLVAVGFAAGLFLGYIFLGTFHALMTSHIHPSDGGGHSPLGSTKAAVERSKSVQEPQKAASLEQASGKAAQAEPSSFPTKGTQIHTLCTSNGSPYLNFQTRINYQTYKKVQGMAGGERLVGFTRILHRTKPDVLMDEVPTFRANPLTPQCDNWCEFPVSDRANAVAQWLAAAKADPSMIKAPWLLMVETDYVWLKPPLPPPAEDSHAPSWAFPFSYISPHADHLEAIMRKMFPLEKGPMSKVPGSGPAPVLMRVNEWIKVVPDWERLTAHIEADEDSKSRLGWVREMYAFSVAAALQDVKLELLPPPRSPLISQPPADDQPGAASMLHYTWGTMFLNSKDNKDWEFDKRTYTAKEIETLTPNIPMPPPFQEGWHLYDGKPITKELYDTLVFMLTQMNAAIDLLPKLSGKVA